MGESLAHVRSDLSARLRARKADIEEAILTRVFSIAECPGADPRYQEGLRSTVAAAVDYGLTAVELGQENAPSIPPEVLSQARMAARNGVDVGIVLRRYFAGYNLLSDFMVQEAERGKYICEAWITESAARSGLSVRLTCRSCQRGTRARVCATCRFDSAETHRVCQATVDR
jgi:hypothetical protein